MSFKARLTESDKIGILGNSDFEFEKIQIFDSFKELSDTKDSTLHFIQGNMLEERSPHLILP